MADDSMEWEVSPPSSPLSNNRDGTIPFRWFACNGEIGSKDTKLSSDGFLLKGEFQISIDYARDRKNFENPVRLFKRQFNPDRVLRSQCTMLFYMGRKHLMILDSDTKLHSRLLKKVAKSLTSNAGKYKEMREEFCELMSFIRCYLASMLEHQCSRGLLKRVVAVVCENMVALRLMLGSLKNLPEYVVAHSASPLGNKCLTASYHLFHLHLDLRWYCFTALHQLIKCNSLCITEDDSEEMEVTLEEEILLLMSDLIITAITKFEKTPMNTLLKKSPFSCSCVKELWLMLQLYIDRLQFLENGQSFWLYLNQLLDVLLKINILPEPAIDCSVLSLPTTYTCSDPGLFCLWLLFHIAQLHGYSADAEFQGIESGRVQSNYSQLGAVLKVCLSTDMEITEPKLRVVTALLTGLITEWWEPNTEPVVLLWEYYHRRLNCAFLVQGSKPAPAAIKNLTGAELLREVKNRLEGTIQNDADSFSLFLRMLGKHLTRCSELNQQKHWQQLKGRIYSKFSRSKMHSLSETGLYHLVSLFLTLAVTGSLQEVGKKMQELIDLLPIQQSDVNRLLIRMKAYIALILLYVERELDITEVSQPLQSTVRDLFPPVKTNNTLTLMRTYVEGVQDIMSAIHRLHLSEYCLMGGWIPQYLSLGTYQDLCQLLNMLVSVLDKVRQVVPIFLDEEADHNRKMAGVLLQQVLPYVEEEYKNIVTQPPCLISDLAAEFTLLALEQPGIHGHTFEQMFMRFVGKEKMNVMLLKRYLCHVLQEEAVMNWVAQEESHENLVIQAWVRCCMLTESGANSDLSDLTKIVMKLPAIDGLCQQEGICLAEEDEPFVSFIKMIGTMHRSMQDMNRKTVFREKCLLYLKHIDKCVKSVLDCATSSKELVNRIYTYCACLVFHCSQILYVRSKPDCPLPDLLHQLLLPHVIYKPETKLHPLLSTAIKKTLHLFVLGLFQLNPRNDECVTRMLTGLVEQYVRRLLDRSSNVSNAFSGHPLILCCTCSEDPQVSRFIIETVSTKINSCAINTLQEMIFVFLTELVTVKKQCADTLLLIINKAFLKVLEVIMFAETTAHNVRRLGLDLIKSVIVTKVFKDENKLRQEFSSVLATLCKKHLAFYSSQVFKLYISIGQSTPELMRSCLPQLEEATKTVEFKRGSGNDPKLRIGLAKVKTSLGVQDV